MLISRNTQDFYFKRLKEELLNQKIRVFLPDIISHYLPITHALLSSKTKLLHLHWIFYIGFDEKKKIKFFLKLCRFIIDVYLSKYILNAKIIWTIHNLYSHKSYYPRIERLVRNFLLNKVNGIICHCNEAKKEVQKEFRISPKKIYVIPHGNYLNCYLNKISKEKARDILNLKKNDFVFLHFGRVRRYKGLDTLIKSFKALKLKDNLKVLIVGKLLENEYKKELITLSEDNKNILFTFKFIEDDKIQIYMNASDIVVSPYRSILTSGEIILAMTFGKPVIAPQLGCIIDLLNKEGSFTYDPKEENGLTIALKEAITFRDKLSNMGKYNLRIVKDLDWKIISIKTKALYEKFI
ncbi:hypothetical protein LCGC14_0920330 [marine sediment metagenome]|uniref:Glycosyl transferase family 1 domain-containing protein n=1 Tax=marine sediment metagenome TaxID=412755 RepID=A0A0F9RXN8_9ZZZZ